MTQLFTDFDITKYYACENCKYNLKYLCKTLPKTLDLIIIFAIFYYYKYSIRIIDIYHSKLEYKIKQFMKAIYYGHEQILDKSK